MCRAGGEYYNEWNFDGADEGDLDRFASTITAYLPVEDSRINKEGSRLTSDHSRNYDAVFDLMKVCDDVGAYDRFPMNLF